MTQIQLTRLLKRAGLVVVGAANNGRTGVEIVLHEKPDIVMMDIRMPIMDGLEATRLIMAETPVCIVMLTAFADAEVREEARKAGSSGFLLKPVTGRPCWQRSNSTTRNMPQKRPRNLLTAHPANERLRSTFG